MLGEEMNILQMMLSYHIKTKGLQRPAGELSQTSPDITRHYRTSPSLVPQCPEIKIIF